MASADPYTSEGNQASPDTSARESPPAGGVFTDQGDASLARQGLAGAASDVAHDPEVSAHASADADTTACATVGAGETFNGHQDVDTSASVRTTRVGDLLHSSIRRFTLSEDVYTSAFLTFLIFEKHHFCGRVAQILIMAVVITIQIVVLSEASNNPINTWFDKVNTWNFAASALLNTNATMPIAIAQQICGTFEQREYGTGAGSKVSMRDGTSFEADEDHDQPVFMSIKLPSNTWTTADMGIRNSHLDEALYVLGDGPRGGYLFDDWTVSYFAIFIMMEMVLFFGFIAEMREVAGFVAVVLHFREKYAERGEPTVDSNLNMENLRILRLNRGAAALACCIVFARVAIAVLYISIGTIVMVFSTTKYDLILNSLALGFVLQLDNMAYLAFIQDTVKTMIQCADPVEYIPLTATFSNPLIFKLVITIVGGFYCWFGRIYQRRFFAIQLQMVTALCFLGGPTPDGLPAPVLAPVVGLCESLLSATCAPKVVHNNSDVYQQRYQHGHCVLRQTERERIVIDPDSAVTSPIFESYLDVGGLYPDMKWASSTNEAPRQELHSTWRNNNHIANMRKYCLQIYQRDFKPDVRTVDQDSKEVMNGGPFFCPREQWQSILAEANDNFRRDVPQVVEEAGILRRWGGAVVRKALMTDFRTVLLRNAHRNPPFFRPPRADESIIYHFSDLSERCRMRGIKSSQPSDTNQQKAAKPQAPGVQRSFPFGSKDEDDHTVKRSSPRSDSQSVQTHETVEAQTVHLDHRGRAMRQRMPHQWYKAHHRSRSTGRMHVDARDRGGNLLRSVAGYGTAHSS